MIARVVFWVVLKLLPQRRFEILAQDREACLDLAASLEGPQVVAELH